MVVRTMGCFALNCLAVRRDELAGHHTQASKALGKDVGLDVTIIVLACPDKSTRRLDGLCDHVVDETMLVVNASLFEGSLILAVKRMIKGQFQGV